MTPTRPRPFMPDASELEPGATYERNSMTVRFEAARDNVAGTAAFVTTTTKDVDLLAEVCRVVCPLAVLIHGAVYSRGGVSWMADGGTIRAHNPKTGVVYEGPTVEAVAAMLARAGVKA